jgi:transposase
MVQPLVSEELWEVFEPLIPRVERRYRYPGRKRIDDRKVLTGILFVLKTGIPWERLPRELGCGSRMTYLLAASARVAAGGCVAAVARAAAREAARGRPDRLVAGCRRLRSGAGCFGGSKTGPSPVNRRKPGSKHHLITDAAGVPLACIVTGANRHDLSQLLALVEAIPPVGGKPGRPRRRPRSLLGDRGYHSNTAEAWLRARKITPVIAHQRARHGSGLGRQRASRVFPVPPAPVSVSRRTSSRAS